MTAITARKLSSLRCHREVTNATDRDATGAGKKIS
jgi:hypothetical protein